MRQILIADNDVIVDLFCTLQISNGLHFQRAMEYISMLYFEMWIPREVEREFKNHPLERDYRARVIERIFYKYQFVKRCPIRVSENEINLENNGSYEDRGETDAMLQSSKALAIPDSRFKFSGIDLFLRDKGAIKRATEKNLSVLHYGTVAIRLREIGILLP
jgi:hypothetical protein